ncbi:MAG: flagellar biosynthetic protein FliQ [Mariniblastus sp.]
MNPQDAVDLSREAIKTCLMVGGPILAASLLIGLLVGVFQAMTQVQDQTVSFVPKILLLIIAIGLCLPWLADQMLDFAKYSFERPMTHWASSGNQKQTFPSQANDQREQLASRTEKSASVASRSSPPILKTGFSNQINPTANQPPNLSNAFPGSFQSSIPNAVQPEAQVPTIPNAVKPIPRGPATSPFLLPQYRQRPNFTPSLSDDRADNQANFDR